MLFSVFFYSMPPFPPLTNWDQTYSEEIKILIIECRVVTMLQFSSVECSAATNTEVCRQILMQIFNITHSTLYVYIVSVCVSIVLYRSSTHFKRWIHAAWGQSVLDFRILEHQHSNG